VTGQVRDERYQVALTVEQGGRPWQIDLTVWLHDLHQNVTRWHEILRERITAEQRGAVLRIKDDWHRQSEYPQQVGGTNRSRRVQIGSLRPSSSKGTGQPHHSRQRRAFLWPTDDE
jgi:hypothetical protein